MASRIPQEDAIASPETSIVIRTFNEERHLPRLLEAIHGQRYRDFEVINVDSGSYDRTVEIARRHGARLLSIGPKDFTFGYSLNVGVEAASGRLVVLVSAHTEPCDDLWLEELIKPLREGGVAMVYGRQQGVANSKFGELRDLARVFGPKPKVLAPPDYFANNANSAFPRVLWKEHPFDEDLPGQEDVEWARHWIERGYKVVYEPRAAIYHIHEESWGQVKRRYYREAVATRGIGVWRRRDAPRLAARELGYLLTDSLAALRDGVLLSRGREIFSFRALKAHGTVAGLLDDKAMATAARRQGLFFDSRSKAVVIHGRNQARLEEVEAPALRPGDVLIRVAYAGVTDADLELIVGNGSLQDGAPPPYPAVPGLELSGWVARTGANVSELEEGDPVVVQSLQGCGSCEACLGSDPLMCHRDGGARRRRSIGAYSEYVSAPGIYVHKLPQEVDMRKAVLVEALAEVLRGLGRVDRLFDGNDQVPRFGVFGAGPIGHLWAMVLSSREMPVTVFDRNPRRLRYFEGTPVAVGSDPAGVAEFDVLVEATRDPESLESVFQASREDAVHLLLGLPASRRQFTINGAAGGEKSMIWAGGARPAEFQQAAKLVTQLPMDTLTSVVVPLAEFREAWERFRGGDDLKILLGVAGDRR